MSIQAPLRGPYSGKAHSTLETWECNKVTSQRRATGSSFKTGNEIKSQEENSAQAK